MSAREHPIGFMADRLEAARDDLRRYFPSAILEEHNRGTIDGVPFVIIYREEHLHGQELSDVRWLPHAWFTEARDELARTRLR